MNIQSLIFCLVLSFLILGCNYQTDKAYAEMEKILDANNAVLQSNIEMKIGTMEDRVMKFPYRDYRPIAVAAKEIQKKTLSLVNFIDGSYPIHREKSEKIEEMIANTQNEVIGILSNFSKNKIFGIQQKEVRNLTTQFASENEIIDNKTALKKVKNDALIVATQSIDFLASKIGHTIFFWDKFIVVSEPKEVFLTKGETFETYIFASQLSKHKIYKNIKVNGKEIADMEDGVGTYKTTPTQYGEHTYDVEMVIENPHNGKTETITETFKYEVGERCY